MRTITTRNIADQTKFFEQRPQEQGQRTGFMGGNTCDISLRQGPAILSHEPDHDRLSFLPLKGAQNEEIPLTIL